MSEKYHKLAEAIREGCKKVPIQCFGANFKKGCVSFYELHEFNGLPDAACASGAAMLGNYLAGNPTFNDYKCPLDCYSGGLFYIVPHLNDTHKWTRERIADWLDTLE